MPESREQQHRNLVLYVGIPKITRPLEELKASPEGKRFRFAVIHDVSKPSRSQQEMLDLFDIVLKANFDSPKSIIEALHPYEDQFIAVTCRSEFNIPFFQKVIPHVPYLRTPTTESLDWATDKVKMRRRFQAYDRTMTPCFKLVKDATKKTVRDIEEKLGFPVVVKPAGLALSLLVNVSYHLDELEQTLKRVFRKISKLYRENKGGGEPQVLVEQLIEGDMYSVDAFVSSRGKVHFCPMVHVKTGRDIGFDDFFAYRTMTPTRLSKQSIADAQEVATKAVYALGLRSSSAHIEMLKTEQGWKVIEVGPRIGGFRHTMYKLSFGIDMTLNDILIRIPRKPVIYNRVKGYTAVFKFFAKKEGTITKLGGIKKAQTLASFYAMKQNKKVGDRATYAKHGGKSVFHVTLFNKDRSKLLADARRLEQMVEIETRSSNGRAKNGGGTSSQRQAAGA